jgi:hypothetical protein
MFSRSRRNVGKEELKQGLKYHMQQKYTEAEPLLRRSVLQREKKLGTEHIDTLTSKDWLTLTLAKQQKYTEAEPLLRRSVLQREKKLGTKHIYALESKHLLALALVKQQKYVEAEQVLQQLVPQQEKVPGVEYIDTLTSKHQLALTLHKQQKYAEAEQVLQKLVPQQEKILGAEHLDTLACKHYLATSLYKQQKYAEAEQVVQQLVPRREKVLGAEHRGTLASKHYLALMLHELQKYAEAEELLRPLVRQYEKVKGSEHTDTLAIKSLVQTVHLAREHIVSTNTLTETVSSLLSDIFTRGKERQMVCTDSEIQQVSLLLDQFNPQWSRVPRTYIFLRTIGSLDLLNTFIDLAFSEHWFPVTVTNLPHCLHPGKRSQFVAAQNLVITKSTDLEKGENGQHCYFRQNEPLPFEAKSTLGTGGFGRVDLVLSLTSFKEYARKRMPRSTVFSGRRTEDIKRFIAEIEVLKRLRHHHVVEFVGCYTDPKYMALIMSPVAEMDLSAYLLRYDMAKYNELRTFFSCLARALEFLHEQNIRHQDIKPGNILVYGGNVLFTDFGLAFDFTDAEGSTTVNVVNGVIDDCTPVVCI